MSRRDPLLDRSIEDEIRHHMRERADTLIEEGMAPAAAEREARRRFGDVRDVRRRLQRIAGAPDPGRGLLAWLESLLRDLRDGARSLRHAPGFSAAVILTVALGVGANVAVFSVTDAVLLRPLPYHEPDRLVVLQQYEAEEGRTRGRVTAATAFAWQRAAADVVPLTLYARVNFVWTDADDPVEVTGRAVSTNWLSMLGVQPALGRSFADEESIPGNANVGIVSDEFWRTRLGADPGVLGRSLTLDGLSYTVVGVMGPQFRFAPIEQIDLWVPLADDATAGPDFLNSISMAARLPDGQSVEAVERRLDSLGNGLQSVNPRPEGWSLRSRPMDTWRANPDVTSALWLMTAAVGTMLLVAVVNAVNLLLARATTRRVELGVRAALGASRPRLLQQQLVENLLLVGAGGVAAIALANLLIETIVGLLPMDITVFLVGTIGLDHRVLGFALATTTIAGIALAVAPALRSTATAARQSSTRWSSDGRRTTRLRSGLVVAEIAMSVTLLVVAGLLIRSFGQLTSVDPGYDPRNLLELSLELPGKYEDAEARGQFFYRLRDDLQALPGVVSASLANGVPPNSGLRVGVRPQPEGGEPRELPDFTMPTAIVDTRFFPTLDVPIVQGRNFTEADGLAGDGVIVDRALARFLFADEHPVGRRFRLDPEHAPTWLTVVGVIDDLKLNGQDDRQGTMDLFFAAHPQQSRGFMSVVMRTAGPPAALTGAARDTVRRLDPAVPIYELSTGDETLARSVDKPRFFLRMMASFAAIALALAVIGTYGVLEFAVRQRHREIGVRVALGADVRRVRSMVVAQGLRLAAIGLVIGLAVAAAAGRVIGNLLFATRPTDPLAIAGVVVVMLGAAALACWVPARRATRVDPVEVLRAE